MARRLKKTAGTNAPVDETREVPGVSPNPATSLLMADIAMRVGSTVLRRAVERGILKGRYGKGNAKDIVSGRSAKQTIATAAAARIATGSLPGAVLVGTGLAAKLLFDRSQKRRKAKRAGDRKLLRHAADE